MGALGRDRQLRKAKARLSKRAVFLMMKSRDPGTGGPFSSE
jgi:hypothetical protein